MAITNSDIVHGSNKLSLRGLIKQIIYYLPGCILPAFLNLLFTVIFTRVFGAKEYGQYSLILSIAFLIAALASQWFQQAINRYLPSAKSSFDRKELKKIITGGLVFITFSLLVLATFFVPVAFLKVNLQWQPYFLPGVLLVVATCLFNPLSVVLQAEMRPAGYTFYNLASSILKLLISLVFVFVISRNATGLVWGTALSMAFLVPFLWKNTSLISPVKILNVKTLIEIRSGLSKFINYGLPMIGWFLTSNLLAVSDRFIIQLFRGSAEVGIYAANYNLVTGAIGLVASPVLLAAHPFLMKAWGQGDREQTGKWLSIITEWFVILGCLLIGFVWVFSEDIARLLLGPQFRSGHIIMPIVLAGMVCWQMGMYTHKPLEFSEKTKLMLTLCLAAAGLNILLNIIFIPQHGYIAAAYSALGSYLFYCIISFIKGKEIIKWNIRLKSIFFNIFMIGVIMTLVTALKQFLIGNSNYITALISSLFIYGLFSMIVIFFNKIIKMNNG